MADDQLDEVVGRVLDYAEATKQYHDTDDVDMTTGGLLFGDLRALLAAYQSVREALEAIARIHENGSDTTIARVQQAYDMRCVARRARTGGTE